MLAIFLLALVCTAHSAFIADVTNNIDLQESPEVNTYRVMVIQNNYQTIQKHNSDPQRTFEMKAYPKFVALTVQQFSNRYLNRMGFHNSPKDNLKVSHPPTPVRQIQSKFQKLKADDKKQQKIVVDLTKGMRTPMYDQGMCGNCYAYAAVDGLNIHNLVKNRTIPRLSIQQLTDCSSADDMQPRNYGCQGGLFHISNIFLMKYGLNSMLAYPFDIQTITEGKQKKCNKVKKSEQTYKIDYWHDIWAQADICGMRLSYIYANYTVVTAIYAGHQTFMYYSSGIISNCPEHPNVPIYMDHAVILVAFTYDPNTNTGHFAAKNSWGMNWGHYGFVFINANGTCNSCVQSYAYA